MISVLMKRIRVYSYIFFFFFNDTATTEIYTLSLHDALPISRSRTISCYRLAHACEADRETHVESPERLRVVPTVVERSEEHTSELQSRSDLVCRLLLEKKNNKN